MTTISLQSPQDFPFTFQIADGSDGSGSHTIDNQHNTNTCTNNFISFCFKLTLSSGKILLPYETNIREFMDNLINPYTDKLRSEGVSLEDNQHEG